MSRAGGVREVGRCWRAVRLLRGLADIAVRLPVCLLAAAVAVIRRFAAGAAALGRAARARRTSCVSQLAL